MDHKVHDEVALILAARGVLYIKANSPKLLPSVSSFPTLDSPADVLTYISNLPVSIT